MYYIPGIDVCILVVQPGRTKVFWGCLVRNVHDTLPYLTLTEALYQAAFDIAAIVIGALNSFDRPYRQSCDIARSLQRDGIAWFLVRV